MLQCTYTSTATSSQSNLTPECKSTQIAKATDDYNGKCIATSHPTSTPAIIDHSSNSHTLTNSDTFVHTLVQCHDKLIAGFSQDPEGIATSLLSKRFIPEEVEAQMYLNSTPREKAAILVTAVRNKVRLLPDKFHELLKILSEFSWTEDLMDILQSNSSGIVIKQPLVGNYKEFLVGLYASLMPTQTSSNQWPPSVTHKVFNLAMIKSTIVRRGQIQDKYTRMTITGNIDDILQEKQPIDLKDLFSKTSSKRQRQVILIEGAPGSGKSTLAVHICHQWKDGKLFQMFKLVVLVQLRDPEVQNAKSISDILPSPNSSTAKVVAADLLAKNCQHVLFILDGWDELPCSLHSKSIFHHLIHPGLSSKEQVQESSVIVTSRPIVSGELHPFVTSRIEVLGFTSNELHKYFTDCLEGDTIAVDALMERIYENPAILGSCYLPLNASILAHLFKCDNNTLPTTQYGIFSEVVLNCIFHHLQERTEHKGLLLDSLDNLPAVVQKPLDFLCELAYTGVMDDQVVFSNLPADLDTLGLLQGVQSIVRRGRVISYNFIHLAIQELLASIYMATKLSKDEQVYRFNKLFNKSRFISVFQFYASITRLEIPGIRNLLIKIAQIYGGKLPMNKDKSLLIHLLRCLYESQNSTLCESLVQYLKHGLYLRGKTLHLSDCLCVGYFLSCVCKTRFNSEFKVYIHSCDIDDQCCQYLVRGLQNCLDEHIHITTKLGVYMVNNHIGEQGAHHLSELLQIGCIGTLRLDGNKNLMDQGAYFIAEKLKNNTTLRIVELSNCGITSKGAKYLSDALSMNSSIEELDLSCNMLGDEGVQQIARFLKANCSMKKLNLHSCGVTDNGLEYLMKPLQRNSSLTQLELWNISGNWTANTITNEALLSLEQYLVHVHNTTLRRLVLPVDCKPLVFAIQELINDVRKRDKLAPIEVTGKYM